MFVIRKILCAHPVFLTDFRTSLLVLLRLLCFVKTEHEVEIADMGSRKSAVLVPSFSPPQVTVQEPNAVFRTASSFVQESTAAATCAYPPNGEQQGTKGTARAWS
jgi:hypothetical protein